MNQRIQYIWHLLQAKTKHCRHPHSCFRNVYQGSAEAFLKAFVAKFCLNALILLFNLRKVFKSDQKLLHALKLLVNKTNVQLGLFVGLQTFLLKFIQCFLRSVRGQEDGWNAMISGFIAGGLSFMTQEENVKYIVRVYLFGRAVDCIYQSLVQKDYFKHRKAIPVAAFALMSMVISYGYFFEPEILPLDTYKMYQNFSQQTLNDSIWHMCNVQAFRNKQMLK